MMGATAKTTESTLEPIEMPTPKKPLPVGPSTDEKGNVIGASNNMIWYIIGGVVLLMLFAKR